MIHVASLWSITDGTGAGPQRGNLHRRHRFQGMQNKQHNRRRHLHALEAVVLWLKQFNLKAAWTS